MRAIFVILVAFLVAGCHESGAWKDDARNWERIFRVTKPNDVTVVRSWFWRSPHFTYEYRYYVQVQKHADLRKRLLTMNHMKQLTEEKELQDTTGWLLDRPERFAPKPIARYEVRVYSDTQPSRFRLMIDRETGDLFLSDMQL